METERHLRLCLICEGSSDEALEGPLRRVAQSALPPGWSLSIEGGALFGHGDLSSKIAAATTDFPTSSLYVIHRDTDSDSTLNRLEEIRRAAIHHGLDHKVAPCVIRQELEALLLADRDALQRTTRATDSELAQLPSSQPEEVRRPKEVLEAWLATLAYFRGGRRSRRRSPKALLSMVRRNVLDEVEPGPLRRLPSFDKAASELEERIAELVREDP